MKHYRSMVKNVSYVRTNTDKYLLLNAQEMSISTRNRMRAFPLLQRTSFTLTWKFSQTNTVCSLLRRRYSTKPKPRSRTHYYDVLGVTPNSTQSEIKSAYYMLSKQLHPDVNKDEKTHSKFSDISEAYEILGNTSKRRLYDHGARVRHQEQTHTGHGAANYSHPFTEGDRFGSERRPPPTGRTPYFNFDEFYRQHYAEAFQREKNERRLFEEMMAARERDEYQQHIRFHLTCFFVVWLIGAYVLLSETESSVKRKDSKKTS